MTPTYRPRLMDATTAADRMDALCEFIEFWNGPRRPEYGIPAAELDTRPLPMPLRRLYEFAGRWPDRDGRSGEYSVPAFSRQDALVAFHKPRSTASGKIGFVLENQGCWECATLPEGDDPPVWCLGDGVDESGNWTRGEHFVCDSLSRFLATFVLQELTFSSRFEVSDDGLEARFREELRTAMPVWVGGPYAGGRDYQFHLWGDVLSMEFGDNFHVLAANHNGGVAFLEANQGPINRAFVTVGLRWDLEVRADGSAEVRYRPASEGCAAEAPPGTFAFPDLVATLGAAEVGEAAAWVSFSRHGQLSGVPCRHVRDAALVTDVYRRAVEACGNSTVAERFRTRWPL